MTNDTPTPDQARRPRPVTPELRARVVALHAEGLGRNAIAREVECSSATVTKIAREAGLSFDRAATALAVRARQIDLAEARAELAASFLVRAQEALDMMDAPMILGSFGGRDNVWNETLLDAPTVEQQNTLMRTAALASKSHAELARADLAAGSTAQAAGMIGALADALHIVAGELAEAGELPDPTVTPEQKPADE
jgi:transposase-like protein